TDLSAGPTATNRRFSTLTRPTRPYSPSPPGPPPRAARRAPARRARRPPPPTPRPAPHRPPPPPSHSTRSTPPPTPRSARAVLDAYGTTAADLRRSDKIPGAFPLWTCLTMQVGSNFAGHSNPLTAERFDGQNVAHADGSVRWHAAAELVPFLSEGTNIYHGPRR